MKPIVAIIGRPNVGKSTLFNRITRKKDALVDNFPGVTRDRHYSDAVWDGVEFTLVDTGGFSDDKEDYFSDVIRWQILEAITDADAVIIVLDGRQGVSPYDRDIIDLLRDISKPVLYGVNKTDSIELEDNLYEFYTLGIKPLYPISAEHGYGVPDFLDSLVKELPRFDTEEKTDIISLAVVGRPNVGKSSLINKIIGEKKLIVSDVPGTTRDAIDSICEYNDKTYLLIDTAGIRRKKKVSNKLEKISIIKSLRSLDRCDVALILIDSEVGVTDQDVKIAGYAYERGCGCIFLLNKWDLIEKDDKTHKKYYEHLRMEAKFLSFAPAMTISALTGLRVPRIFSLVDEVFEQYTTRVTTGKLNSMIERATLKTEPSLHKGKRIKFYYSSQISEKPPTFISFVNYPKAVHFSYKRYLINQIRDEAGLDKTPIRLMFKEKSGRIDFGSKKKNRNQGSKKYKKKK